VFSADGIRHLPPNHRPRPQYDFEPEFTRQFEKYHEVLAGIVISRKINMLCAILMDIPRHGRSDNPKTGPTDALETDRPVSLVDSEVVEFS
jgi:hypothetical protein